MPTHCALFFPNSILRIQVTDFVRRDAFAAIELFEQCSDLGLRGVVWCGVVWCGVGHEVGGVRQGVCVCVCVWRGGWMVS
jgi:hypothetical protein